MNIHEFRQQYPQYNDLSDYELTEKLHRKYYPDMELLEFSERFGVPPSLMRPTIIMAETPGPVPDVVPPMRDAGVSATPQPSAPSAPSAPLGTMANPGEMRVPDAEKLRVLLQTPEEREPLYTGISPQGMDEIAQSVGLPAATQTQLEDYDRPPPSAMEQHMEQWRRKHYPRQEELPAMQPVDEPGPFLSILRSIFGDPEKSPETDADAIIANQARRWNMTPKQYAEAAVKPSGGGLERGIRDIVSGAAGVAQGGMAEVARRTDSIPLREAAVKLGETAQALQPADPNYIDKILSGVGSMAAFYVPGMGLARGVSAASRVSTGMSLWLGSSAAAGMEASAEAGMKYMDEIRSGATEDQAQAAADDVFWKNAALVGVTNRLGLFGDKAQTGMRRAFTAAIEGAQEGGQELIAGGTIPEAAEAASIGAIVGDAMAGSMKTPAQALGDRFADAIEGAQFPESATEMAAASLRPTEFQTFPRVREQIAADQGGEYRQGALPPGQAEAQPPVIPEKPPQPVPDVPDVPDVPRTAPAQKVESNYDRARKVKETDSLIVQIAKLGGIGRAKAEAQGVDPADFKRARWGIQRAFNSGERAQSFDGMAETLRQYGWNFQGPNDLLVAIDAELRGNPQYAPEGSMQIGDQQREALDLDPTLYNGDMYAPDLPDGTPAYPGDLDEEGKTLFELYTEASKLDQARALEIMESGASDSAVAQSLYEVINERSAQTGRSDGQPAPDDRGGAAVPGVEPVADQATRAGPRETPTDLAGEYSPTAQAIHDRQLERQRRIDQAPPVESGAGDLFSGGDRQTDIEDVAGVKQDAKQKPETGRQDGRMLPQSREDAGQMPTEKGGVRVQPSGRETGGSVRQSNDQAAIDDKIRNAGHRLADYRWNERVFIADLVNAVSGEMSQEDVHSALLQMADNGQAALYPIENARERSPTRENAGIWVGGENNGIVYFEPPSTQRVSSQNPKEKVDVKQEVITFDEWDRTRKAYRKGEIGDEEFLTAQRRWQENQDAFDRERGETSPTKGKPAQKTPAKLKSAEPRSHAGKGKPLSEIKIVQDATIAETGKPVKFSQRADTAIAQIDERIDKLETILDCLK